MYPPPPHRPHTTTGWLVDCLFRLTFQTTVSAAAAASAVVPQTFWQVSIVEPDFCEFPVCYFYWHSAVLNARPLRHNERKTWESECNSCLHCINKIISRAFTVCAKVWSYAVARALIFQVTLSWIPLWTFIQYTTLITTPYYRGIAQEYIGGHLSLSLSCKWIWKEIKKQTQQQPTLSRTTNTGSLASSNYKIEYHSFII